MNTHYENGAIRISNVFAGFFIFIFILSLIPTLFFIPTQLVLFSPSLYKKELAATSFYQNLPGYLATHFLPNQIQNSNGDLPPTAISGLTKEDYLLIYNLIVPGGWLQSQVENNIEQIFSYLNFKNSKLTLLIDLGELKLRVNGNVGNQVAQVILNSWPDCTNDELFQLGAASLTGQIANIPICQPPALLAPVRGMMLKGIQAQIESNIPDQINLGSNFETEINSGTDQKFWSDYRLIRTGMKFAPIICLISLGIAVIFLNHSPRRMFSWISMGMFFSGLCGAATSIMLYLVEISASRQITLSLISTPNEVFEPFLTVFNQVWNNFVFISALISTSVLFVGLVIFIGVQIYYREKVR